MTFLVLIFAEVLPKTWAISTPDRFAVAVAPILRIVVIVFGPVTLAVQIFVRWLLRRFGIDVDASLGISPHEEIRGTVDLQHYQGGLHKAERDRLGSRDSRRAR